MAAGPVAMQEPVCLINNEEGGGLSVQQEALEILQQIQQPVVVVTIVGPYRSGKSYLMNRLAGKETGEAMRTWKRDHISPILASPLASSAVQG